MLKNLHRVIVCERSEERLRFVREHYPGVEVTTPKAVKTLCCAIVPMEGGRGVGDGR